MKPLQPSNGQPVNGQAANRQPVPDPVPVAAAAVPAEDPGKELTEEEKTAKAAAEAAAKKIEDDKKVIADFQKQLAELRLAVTKAQWPQVNDLLKNFSETEQTTIYDKLLQSLIMGTPDSPRNREGQIIGERNLIRAVDVIAIGELCPAAALAKAQTLQLGQLVTACNAEGEADYAFSTAIREHTAVDAKDQKLTKRIAAQILFAANRADEALEFLPTLEVAQKDSDLEALDLLSDTLLALHQKKADRSQLERLRPPGLRPRREQLDRALRRLRVQGLLLAPARRRAPLRLEPHRRAAVDDHCRTVRPRAGSNIGSGSFRTARACPDRGRSRAGRRGRMAGQSMAQEGGAVVFPA